uniref:MATH domain-containing protein n=1 Tax=Eutreptiella gymnastica TaxID=73025 RepID=A0A7S4CX39_9EUGL
MMRRSAHGSAPNSRTEGGHDEQGEPLAKRNAELEESMTELRKSHKHLRNSHKELERLLTESARSDTFNVTWRITGVKGLVDAKQCIYSETLPIASACGGMYLTLSFQTDEDNIEWIGCYLSHTADCGKTHKIAGSSISFVLQSGNITETFDDGTKISGPGEGWSDFCKVAWLLEDDGWRLSGDDELQVELKLRLDDRHYHVNTYLPI